LVRASGQDRKFCGRSSPARNGTSVIPYIHWNVHTHSSSRLRYVNDLQKIKESFIGPLLRPYAAPSPTSPTPYDYSDSTYPKSPSRHSPSLLVSCPPQVFALMAHLLSPRKLNHSRPPRQTSMMSPSQIWMMETSSTIFSLTVPIWQRSTAILVHHIVRAQLWLRLASRCHSRRGRMHLFPLHSE
jgi:hypothetical protein